MNAPKPPVSFQVLFRVGVLMLYVTLNVCLVETRRIAGWDIVSFTAAFLAANLFLGCLLSLAYDWARRQIR